MLYFKKIFFGIKLDFCPDGLLHRICSCSWESKSKINLLVMILSLKGHRTYFVFSGLKSVAKFLCVNR